MNNTSFAGLDVSLMKPSTRIYDMVYAPLETLFWLKQKLEGLNARMA